MSPVRVITGIRKQLAALTRRLLVIERLIVRQRLGKIENMNRGRHIFMDQADELEIPGNRENDGKGLSLHHWWSGHAGRTIVGGWIGRKARTSHIERWARLVGFEKGQGMDIVRVERPLDAVARVNPDFIGKKRQSLDSLVVTLRCHSSVPLRLHHLRKDQDGKQQYPAGDR